MDIIFEGKNTNIAVMRGGRISTAQDALDLIGETYQNPRCAGAVVFREVLAPDFFVLRNGLAGEVLQKFSNYGIRLAIVGDFSDFTSGPMHDFIYESNRAGHVLFVPSLEDAFERLNCSAGK